MKKTLSGEDPFGWVSSLVGQAESRDDPKGPHVLTSPPPVPGVVPDSKYSSR